MAAQVAHGAVAEVPPAVPLRAGEVDLVERPRGRGAEPEVPVEARRGSATASVGPLADGDDVAVLRWRPPSDCRPQARPTQTWASRHRADGAGLDQLDDAAVVVARRGSACPSGWRPWPCAAASRMTRASQTLCVSGFSQ